MSFTGISEIDKVLQDLFNEQVLLEQALSQSPHNHILKARHRRIVDLTNGLIQIGQQLQLAVSHIPDNT